jgi:pimeloyl-ACP methyl ester carboxylesterase
MASGVVALGGPPAPADADDKFLTSAKIGDVDLYYEIHGEGAPVVLAHGAGGTHMSWWQQVPVLSQRHRCITIDHRTSGDQRV